MLTTAELLAGKVMPSAIRVEFIDDGGCEVAVFAGPALGSAPSASLQQRMGKN